MSQAPDQAPAPRRRPRAPLVLGVVSLVLGLALCEFSLRVFMPQVSRQPPIWRYDEELGWSHVAGASGRMVSPEFDVQVRINSDGLRDREYLLEKPPNVHRILVFGDSFAEGWGVPIDRGICDRLESELRSEDESGTEYEVLNFGVAGYGTDQELLLFRQQGVRYNADEVVVLFYANDLWNNQSRTGIGIEGGHKPYFGISGSGEVVLQGVPVKKNRYWDFQEGTWVPPASRRLQRYLFDHWHTFALVAKAFRPSPVPTTKQALYYQGLYGRTETATGKAGWRLTRALLVEFQRVVAATGARMHLVYIPAIVQVEEENWQFKRQLYGLAGDDFELSKPNRLLGAMAADHEISFIDLTQTFVAAAGERILYYRDSHWNEDGHALAARLVAEHLRLLLDVSSTTAR